MSVPMPPTGACRQVKGSNWGVLSAESQNGTMTENPLAHSLVGTRVSIAAAVMRADVYSSTP
jgi:hypothetical protein